MTALKPNILSWAWAVQLLLNTVEVEVFSLAKALPINRGYVDCSLQIKAMQTIPWKAQLQHCLTTRNVCQVTQVSTLPVWFHSYFTPGLWLPDYPYCSRAAFSSNSLGQLFLSKRKCWHSWQTANSRQIILDVYLPGLDSGSMRLLFSTAPESLPPPAALCRPSGLAGLVTLHLALR